MKKIELINHIYDFFKSQINQELKKEKLDEVEIEKFMTSKVGANRCFLHFFEERYSPDQERNEVMISLYLNCDGEKVLKYIETFSEVISRVNIPEYLIEERSVNNQPMTDDGLVLITFQISFVKQNHQGVLNEPPSND